MKILAIMMLSVLPSCHSNIRQEFIDNVASGIEIGYLCQKRGFTEDECKTDFKSFMTKPKS